jgi:hypothetical protein
MSNADLIEYASELFAFADPNRYLVEVPDSFFVARWSRDAATADTTALRHALEGLIEHELAAT